MQRIAAGLARTPAERLRQAAVEAAERFGLDPADAAKMKAPVLIRELAEAPGDPQALAVLVRQLNVSRTQAVSAADRGVSAARSLSPVTREAFAAAVERAGDDAPTIREALRGNRDVVRALEADGVISAERRNELISRQTGQLNERGLSFVEETLLGMALPDGDLVDALPGGLRQKVLRAVPAVMRAEIDAPDAGFAKRLEGAVRSEYQRLAEYPDAKERPSVDEFVSQRSMTPAPSQLDPATAALQRLIAEKKPTEVAEMVARYADEVALATNPQAGMLGEVRPSVDEVFESVFGVRPQTSKMASLESPTLAQNSGSNGGAWTSKSSRGSSIDTQAPDRQASTTWSPSEPTNTVRTGPPSIQRANQNSRGSVGGIDPASGKKVLHEDLPVEEILRRAREAEPALRQLLTEATEGTRSTFAAARVKEHGDRLQQKLSTGRPPSTISDYLGARVSLDRLEDAQRIIESLKRRGLTVLEDDDMLSAAATRTGGAGVESGYQARHLQVFDPQRGISYEVQLIPRELLAVLDEGHKIYNVVRDPQRLAAEASARGVSVKTLKRDLEAKSQHLYRNAMRAFRDRVGAMPTTPAAADAPPRAPGGGGAGARAPPAGSPGRGFGFEVEDLTPRFRHSAKILGDRSEAFMRAFLEDPKQGALLEARRRGVVTEARRDELAQKVQLAVKDYTTAKQGTILPAEVQTHLAALIHENQKLLELADSELQRAHAARDNPRIAAGEALRADLQDNLGKLVLTLEASRSEAGRTLGARLGVARSEALARKALRSLMEEVHLPGTVRARLAAEIQANRANPARVIQAVREAYMPTWWQKLQEVRINFMLGNPLTVLRNVVGNTAATAARIVEAGTGVAVDATYELGRRLTGRPGDANRRRAYEILGDVSGTLHGARAGARLALRALRDENFAIASTRVGEELHRIPAVAGRKGEILRLPSRIQGAADELFYTMNAEGTRYRIATRVARNEGLTGKGLWRRVGELVGESRATDGRKVERIVKGQVAASTPAERIAAAAHRDGLEYTFRAALGEVAGGFERMRQSDAVPGKALKTAVPFFRTPVNLTKFNLQRSMLGFLSPRNWTELRSGNRDLAVDTIARMAVGNAIGAGLVAYALDGRISGAPPKDPAAREALEATGWQPYSIRIGDTTWVNYQGWSPLSEQLALAASVAKSALRPGESSFGEHVTRIGLSVIRQASDQPYLTGLRDVMDAIEAHERGPSGELEVPRLLGRLAASFAVPRGVAFVARSTDDLRRARPESVGEQIRQDVPGLRQGTVEFRDYLGRVQETPDAALQAWVRHRGDRASTPLDAWLWSIQESPDRAVIGYPSRTQLGRRLSPEQYRDLQKERGMRLLPQLERARSEVERQGAPPLAARRAVQEVNSAVTGAVEHELVPRFELEALGLPAEPEAVEAVRGVMSSAPIQEYYSRPERTDAEKVQLLGLVSAARRDPRARAALVALVRGVPNPAR